MKSRPLMRPFALLCLLAASLHAHAQDVEIDAPGEKSPQASLPYVEREFYLPDPLAMPPGLDSIEVRPNLPGKRPVVLLTHGTASDPVERSQVTPWRFLPQALWFARRGYVALVVVRRGYGRSGGEYDGRQGGCGVHGSFVAAADAGLDDLRFAARYAARLPEADATTIVSVGVSTGGLVQVAAAADPMPGLKAAISFAGGRGGDGKGHNCNLDGLVSAFHFFGKHNKLPMLWIYAENDKWFPPAMARSFDAAFRKGGGAEEFVMTPPDGEDGHHLFSHVSRWSPIVEQYLRRLSLLPLHEEVLPPPVLPDVSPPPGLPAPGRAAFRQFLMNGPFKAFAVNESGAWGSSTGQFTQDIADRFALQHCAQKAGGAAGCKVIERGPH